jgi:hypothetical protein
MRLCLLLALLFPATALADRWEPYPDGRPGGCFVNQYGVRYDCKNPAPVPPPKPGNEQTLIRGGDTSILHEGPKREYPPDTPMNLRGNVVRADHYQAEKARQERLENAPAERQRIRALEERSKGCPEALARLGYTVRQGGICRKDDGSFVSCPPCPKD